MKKTDEKLQKRAEQYVRSQLRLGARVDDLYFHLAAMAYIAGFKGGVRSGKLTWEDVSEIIGIEQGLLSEGSAESLMALYPSPEHYFGEILKRYNKKKR